MPNSILKGSVPTVYGTEKNDAEDRDRELVKLHPLSREIPNIDSAIAEIARYSAELTLPKGTIHIRP
jgi:hypothetical protein